MSSIHSPILVVMAAIAGHTDDGHHESGKHRDASSAAIATHTGASRSDTTSAFRRHSSS